MSDTPKKEIKLFYCYAHEDKTLRDELEIHLSGLKRQYRLTNWYDRQILPGEDWEQAIDKNLTTADLILLLISPHFMASDYCYGKEMQRALERHQAGTCRVIPILLRPTYYWEEAPFSTIQLLPTDAIPITRWVDRDEAFHNVVMGIGTTIKAWLGTSNSREDKLKQHKTLTVAQGGTTEEESIRDLVRLQRGVRTPEEAYYQPILKALNELGGSAKMNDVLEKVEQSMKEMLKPADYEMLGSGTNIRWRNTAQWARNSLVKEGLLKSNSPRGIWEITEVGHMSLRHNQVRLQRGARTPEEVYYRPILKALNELGGSAKMNDVLEKVEQSMKNVLKQVDYEPLASDTEMLRWRNTAQWARHTLVKENLLKSNSPRGIWEITEKGRMSLTKEAD